MDVEKTLSACRLCPNYNRRWPCPENKFSPVSLWEKFTTADLYCVQVIYDEDLMSSKLSTAKAQDLLNRSLEREKRQLRERLELKAASIKKSLVLSPGTCELCPVCAREEGKPCRYPRHSHYSIESLGGDVEAITKNVFGLEIIWMEGNALPPYLTAVGAILRH